MEHGMSCMPEWCRQLLIYIAYTKASAQDVTGIDAEYNRQRTIAPIVWCGRSVTPFCELVSVAVFCSVYPIFNNIVRHVCDSAIELHRQI